MAEFATAAEVLAAARAVRAAGYRDFEVYSPFPIEGVSEVLGFRSRLPAVTFIAGLVGGATIFAFQAWVHVIDWTLNIGGRAPLAAPAFIVPSFEVTILVAALSTVVAMLAQSGLPRPHHPLFAVAAFERATHDRFFLAISAADPRFDDGEARAFLRGLGPLEVHDVPA
jgi:hypothetical protein